MLVLETNKESKLFCWEGEYTNMAAMKSGKNALLVDKSVTYFYSILYYQFILYYE